jgi:hypothetical protein
MVKTFCLVFAEGVQIEADFQKGCEIGVNEMFKQSAFLMQNINSIRKV